MRRRVVGILILLFSCGVLFSQEKKDEFVYDAKGRRDPFTPLVTKDGFFLSIEQAEGSEEVSLEGIIYDENGVSYAIINGSVLKTGDKLDDLIVLKIEENKVIVSKDGEILSVELREGEE